MKYQLKAWQLQAKVHTRMHTHTEENVAAVEDNQSERPATHQISSEMGLS